MSGIHRFLSRRDKRHHRDPHHEKPRQTAGHLHGLFTNHEEQVPEKDEEKKIKALSQRLAKIGITHFQHPDIDYVLNASYAKGDPEKAFDLLVLLQESEQGIIKEYNPDVKLLGAVNRHGVTCYLDATLFAMFARLESFEAILYNTFEDETRKRLAILLRLWVNTLRIGKLITADITKQLQEALAACGWKEAAERNQQDASEAFSFITEKLELPMLTLKMDIFHSGKEDANDDHKFVKERLLEVAIPEEPMDGSGITLEDCLETYFNSRIEVKRYQEHRRLTLTGTRSRISLDSTKGHAAHIESIEVDDSQPSTPLTAAPTNSPLMSSPLRQQLSRQNLPSIVQEHHISEKCDFGSPLNDDGSSQINRPRAGSARKEAVVPAFQFFSIIPWYTDAMPSNDAQVAAHFASKRPVLGICLKRYSMLPNGEATRRKSHVDIPVEIGLPHFIHDDTMSDDGAAIGNFKLSLQSAVCHRGNSVHSGHYISLVRGQASNAKGGDMTIKSPSNDRWMLFDDLAKERIRYVDIEKALMDETPYLLFYQLQPIGGENLPSYSLDSKDSGIAGLSPNDKGSKSSNDGNVETTRPSFDGLYSDGKLGRSSMTSERRLSIALTDTSITSVKQDQHVEVAASSLPSVNGFLGSSRRESKLGKLGSGSRPVSAIGSKRLSASFSQLASKLGKDRPEITIDAADAGPQHDSPDPLVAQSDTSHPSDASISGKENSKRQSDHGKDKDGRPDRECRLM